jgi:transposase InsO family protein
MAERGIAGIKLRRRVRTTIAEPCDEKVPDLVKRDFTAPLPNRKYVGDITYLPLADGSNLYLATVIDCCSRKLAGWAVADHMRTELVTGALKAALADRGSLRGAVFHADHGAQYTSKDLAQRCAQLWVTQSLGGVGSSADNALAEAFNATFKRETLAGAAAFTDEASCRREIFRWAVRYNTRRRHSHLGHQAPNTYENKLTATLPGSRVIKHTPCPRSGGQAPLGPEEAASARGFLLVATSWQDDLLQAYRGIFLNLESIFLVVGVGLLVARLTISDETAVPTVLIVLALLGAGSTS